MMAIDWMKNTTVKEKKKHLLYHHILPMAVSAAMLVTGVSGSTLSVQAEKNGNDTNISVETQVKNLLTDGKYAKGEVIALVKGSYAKGEKGPIAKGSQVECISSMNASVYEEFVDFDETMDDASEAAGAENANFSKTDKVSIVHIVDKNKSTKELLTELLSDENVLMAEPNRTYQVESEIEVPTSSESKTEAVEDVTIAKDATSNQWAYANDGTFAGTKDLPAVEGFDMNPPSWNTYDASKKPVKNATGVVAIMDTGIDYNHPELKNIVMNDMRKYNDIGGDHGYYPMGKEHEEPMDLQAHGTHCAGIIAGEWNQKGISGIASGCKIVSVKISIGDTGAINVVSAIEGYEYLSKAVDQGLQLVSINNSWGGKYDSDIFGFVAYELGRKGAVTVFASGNESNNMDHEPGTVNSMCHNPYVVAVNSVDSRGQQSYFSNYGKYTTDLYAPGSNILSTVPCSKSTFLTETDPDPLFKESFHGETDVFIGPFLGEDVFPEWWTNPEKERKTMPSKRVTEFGYEHNDSVEINVKDLSKADPDTPYSNDMLIYLPVNRHKIAQLQALSLAMWADRSYFHETPEILVKTETGYEWIPTLDAILSTDSSDWRRVSFNLNNSVFTDGITQENLVTIPTQEEDTVWLPLRVNLILDSAEYPDHVYVDEISLHTKGSQVPIAYMSGTSMATPAVAGAASIVAKEQMDQGIDIFDKTKREQAALDRANILKGRVRHSSSIEDHCRQGGMLDFDVTTYTPVINHTIIEGNRLIIQGAFFGNTEGSVSLDQKIKLSTLEWKDDEITAELPADLKSSGYTLQVTNSDGFIGKNNAEIITENRDSLFEKEIPLQYSDDSHRKNVQEAKIATGDGKLYVIYSDAINDNGFRQLWSYDLEKEEWSRCADLPREDKGLAAVEMIKIKQGMLTYLTWYDPNGANGLGFYQSEMYIYDPQTDQFTKLETDKLIQPSAASLVSLGGEVYLVGGQLYYSRGKGEDYSEESPTFKHVHVDVEKKTWSSSDAGDLKCGDQYIFVDGPAVSVSGDQLYLLCVAGTDVDHSNTVLLRAKLKDGKFVTEDLSKYLPEFYKKHLFDGSKVVEALKNGLLIFGTYEDDSCTSVFYKDNSEKTFQEYGKEIYPSKVYYIQSCQCDGYLYAIGRIQGQSGIPLIIRGTKVESPDNQIPDLHGTFKKDVTVKATTKKDGYIGRVCDVCKDVTVETEIPRIKSVKLQNSTSTQKGVPCYQYTGKTIKPAVVVKDAKGQVIPKKYYTVTYSNCKKIGKARCEVKFKGLYSGTVVRKYYIVPKAPKKLTVTRKSANKLAVKWSSVKHVNGYQICYQTGTTKKYKTIKNSKVLKTTLSKLEKNKTYTVSVRAYQVVKGKKYYSKFNKK